MNSHDGFARETYEQAGNPGKLYAVGDIHGCLNPLQDLLAQIPLCDEDTVVFLGDYIDRGPRIVETVDALLSFQESHRRVRFLMGNHEWMFLDWLAGKGRDLFLANGGRSTLQAYGLDRWPHQELPAGHGDFFQSLLPYVETNSHIFVHAGLRPGLALPEQTSDDLLWIRGEFIYSAESFGKQVVFGHTPFPEPYRDAYKIGIDTGAVYGGKLTALNLTDRIFYSA